MAEHQIVDLGVAGSNPASHPYTQSKRLRLLRDRPSAGSLQLLRYIRDTAACKSSSAWVIDVEDDFTIAMPAATLETGRGGVDRRFVQPHLAEDPGGEPQVPKACPAVGMKVACFGTGESFDELAPAGMVGQ